MNQRNVAFAVLTVLGLLLDQGTKYWIFQNVAENVQEIPIIPGFFSIVHRQNPGAAFGLFRDFEYRHWLFLAFTVVAGFFILDMLRKSKPNDVFLGAALGLVFSGAVGNAIDRVAKQTVTDFLKVYVGSGGVRDWLVSSFGTAEWPSFNVADAALVVGIALYVIHSTWFQEKPPQAVPSAAAPPAT